MRRMGEFELLRRVREMLPPAGGRVELGPGDDTAVSMPGGATATSVDLLVEGVHFLRGTASLRQVGRKALAAALSDLAAMGAEPGEAYIGLGVPADLDEDGCLELLEGSAELAARTGTTLAGGDVSRAPALIVSVTVVGHAPAPERFVRRAGARPGDELVLSGELGAAAAGLIAEQSAEAAAAIEADTLDELLRRLRDPAPRLAAGAALAAAGAHAMIDVSDGLGADAGHIAEGGGVRLLIDGDLVPRAQGVREVALAAGRDPAEVALAGGEDYELLAALPPGTDLGELSTAAGTGLTRIGEVVAGSGVEIRLPREGRTLPPAGYDQLAG